MVRSISKNRIIRNLFHKLAPVYDLLDQKILGRRGLIWRRRAISVANLTRPHRVLDGCCGTGILAIELAQVLDPHSHIVAADFCPAMMIQAKQKFRHQHLHRRVEFKTENVEIMPFPDEFFDAVFICFGLRFVSDIRIVLRESLRVLRKRGSLVILELANPANPLVRVVTHLSREYWLPFRFWSKWRVPRNLTHPLFDSLFCYPEPDKLLRMLVRVGFEQPRYEKLGGGSATLHWGIKPGIPEKEPEEVQ